jgi:hypothetical protein
MRLQGFCIGPRICIMISEKEVMPVSDKRMGIQEAVVA